MKRKYRITRWKYNHPRQFLRNQYVAWKGKQLFHAAGFLPVHQFLGWRGQVEGRHDVGSVGQLQLHRLAGNRLLLVDHKLPLFPYFTLGPCKQITLGRVRQLQEYRTEIQDYLHVSSCGKTKTYN